MIWCQEKELQEKLAAIEAKDQQEMMRLACLRVEKGRSLCMMQKECIIYGSGEWGRQA